MTFNKLKEKLWLFFFTQAVVPFDVAFASYCVYGGVSGILKWGIASNEFADALGIWALVFNVWYVLSGLALFFGIGARRKDIQSFGLVSIITALLIRIIVISWKQGLSELIIGLYFVNAIFIVSCVVRLYMLFKYTYILKLRDTVKDNAGAK